MSHPSAGAVDGVFRLHWGRAVAALVAETGDIELAEDSVQDALVRGLQTWPRDGVPRDPAAWIVATARNRARDVLRRSAAHRRALPDLEATTVAAEDAPEIEGEADTPAEVRDERLRLMFMCCHPTIAEPARVALTLRLVAGLTVPQIARAFLESEAAVSQRLVRAKRKIRATDVPFRVPPEHLLGERLQTVMRVVYLVFTEGHTATAGPALTRPDLCREGIRLGRALRALVPGQPEVSGLLALMLLTDARRGARTDAGGRLVTLADQDRSLWNREAVDEGRELVAQALAEGPPGPYRVQAAIAAVHAEAAHPGDTDWRQIVALYTLLMRLTPSPVVALNRGVAIAEADGPAAGLAALEPLAGRLREYAPFHASRAELLRRCGDEAAAARAYRDALAHTDNAAERAHLTARLGAFSAAAGDVAPGA